MEQPKPYEPSEEEVKKAENMMTKGQKKDSKERLETYEAGLKSVKTGETDYSGLRRKRENRAYIVDHVRRGDRLLVYKVGSKETTYCYFKSSDEQGIYIDHGSKVQEMKEGGYLRFDGIERILKDESTF